MNSMTAAVGLAAALAVGAWGGPRAAADGPVSTPPAPTTPADNDLDHAKRDADKTANDADRSTGNALADKQPADPTWDGKAATAATAGAVQPAVADADAIRRVLANVVVAAVTPDHMDWLTQRLGQPDRDRIRAQPDYGQNYGPTLDDTARSLGLAWQAKYGRAFNVVAAAAAMTDAFASVRQGLPGTGNRSDGAEITVAASHGLPQSHLSFVREMPDGWKADVPDTLGAVDLRKNLEDELGAAVSMKDRWPADEAEAYRAVTHRVILALTNQPLPPAE
jgi:hypothetical protein